jgi:hypothetical protein
VKFAGKCVVITGPLRTTEEFDQMATVAALVSDSGGFPVWPGDIAWPLEADLNSLGDLADAEARLLETADIVIAMPGWENSPAFVEVLTAEQAGAELVEIGRIPPGLTPRS